MALINTEIKPFQATAFKDGDFVEEEKVYANKFNKKKEITSFQNISNIIREHCRNDFGRYLYVNGFQVIYMLDLNRLGIIYNDEETMETNIKNAVKILVKQELNKD